MGKKVLITGGSGTVGEHLSKLLLKKGYRVANLSRSSKIDAHVETFVWDIDKGLIDENCIKDVSIIIHLVGAGIADSNWTNERKKVIIDSRTKSIQLIYNLLKIKKHKVETVVSASASGFYSDRGNDLMSEDNQPNSDFMALCCIAWENAVDEGNALGLRVVKFRTGVILDKDSGALPKISAPVKYGFGAPLGSGKQWISWIHIDDVVAMYLKGIEDDKLRGAYNMSTPYPLTNYSLTNAIAKQFNKPLWLPNVPSFVLKMIFGEMSIVVLGSTKMDTKKIEETNFRFKFPEIKAALKNIYG